MSRVRKEMSTWALVAYGSGERRSDGLTDTRGERHPKQRIVRKTEKKVRQEGDRAHKMVRKVAKGLLSRQGGGP